MGVRGASESSLRQLDKEHSCQYVLSLLSFVKRIYYRGDSGSYPRIVTAFGNICGSLVLMPEAVNIHCPTKYRVHRAATINYEGLSNKIFWWIENK